MITRTCLTSLVALILLPVPGSPAADWPMLGRDVTRNPVSPERNPPLDWNIETGRNIKWKAHLGSTTHGTPVVADGQVYIGTNNGAGYLERYPRKVDLGVLLCFRESDGEFLWQYSAEKLPTGRVHDWPTMGIGSSPQVEGDRMWFVSNRWDVVCLDTQGFRDGENDGPVTDEAVYAPNEADVVWTFDMMGELGVSPYGQGMGPQRRCSPAGSYKNRLYFLTGKGVDESHSNIPTPDAPSLICLNKQTGRVLWTDNTPGVNTLSGDFASPLVAEIAGRPQVIVPQADGWIRSFEAMSGELIWKFDVNRKEAKWNLGGGGNRNHVLATPVLYDNHIYVASGREAEHGAGPGRLVCIDPTKTGDTSSELAVDASGEIIPHRRMQAVMPAQGERAIPNPNSGLIWEFTSAGDEYEDELRRTIATVAIQDGLLVLSDIAGLVHCFDAKTGKRLWYYDCIASAWSTPLIVDGRAYICDEDGDVAIFDLTADANLPKSEGAVERQPIAEINVNQSMLSSPIFANGTLFLPTRSMLYAIAAPITNAGLSRNRSHRDQSEGTDPVDDSRRIPNATFTPTPQDVVAVMLELAAVQTNDVVFDLGSGDGRIVITAAKTYGCRAVGYEIDGQLVNESQAAAAKAGVEGLVTFHRADLFTANLKEADVITLFLLPIQNKRLISMLNRMRPGTRIVTYHFEIPGIVPDKVVQFQSTESGEDHTLFLYTIPLTEAEPGQH